MRLLILFFVFLFSSCSFANPYSIEDEDFSPAPENLSREIESDKSFKPFFAAECRLKTKEIPLAEKHKQSRKFFLATTADECGWGSALGPIWIVSERKNGYKQIFYQGGYSIDVLDSATNGVHDIKLITGGADSLSDRKYKYADGRFQEH